MLAGRESGADYRERVAQRYPPTCVSVSFVMAQRKPKSIADDIVGGIRNIMSPWLATPPTQNNKVTQAQGLARSAAENLDQAFAGGMVKAGVQGNKALAKQAAVNAVALGVGYVAGKTIQTAAGAVVKSGVIPRTLGRITERESVYFLHGSPYKNIKELKPQFMPEAVPIPGTDKALWEREEVSKELFGTMVSHTRQKGTGVPSKTPSWSIPEVELKEKLDRNYGYTRNKRQPTVQGSIYLAKTPKSAVYDWGDEMTTSKLAPVVKEFPVGKKTSDQMYTDVNAYLKQMGIRVKNPKKR